MNDDELIARRPPEGTYWTLGMEKQRSSLIRKQQQAAKAEEARRLRERQKQEEKAARAIERQSVRSERKRLAVAASFYSDVYYQSIEWAMLREEILQRDGFTCKDCGAPASICSQCVPASEGGIPIAYNLFASCGPCSRTRAQQRRGAKKRAT